MATLTARKPPARRASISLLFSAPSVQAEIPSVTVAPSQRSLSPGRQAAKIDSVGVPQQGPNKRRELQRRATTHVPDTKPEQKEKSSKKDKKAAQEDALPNISVIGDNLANFPHVVPEDLLCDSLLVKADLLHYQKDERLGIILKGATLEGLLRISLEFLPDARLLSHFFLTHHQFTRGEEVFDVLLSLIKDPQQESFHDIQNRVVQAICIWMDVNVKDFESDEVLKKRVEDFIENFMTSHPAKSEEHEWGVTMINAWEASLKVFSNGSLDQEGPVEGAPKVKQRRHQDGKITQAVQLHVTELARQMTLFDHHHFCTIPMNEFTNSRFSKVERCPQITTMIQRFNEVTKWVATEILAEPILKHRVKTFIYFITLAEELQKLKNWESFLAVVYGLSQFSISRLKKTMKLLSTSELSKLENMQNLANPMGNFSKLRPFHDTELTDCITSDTPKSPTIKSISVLVKDLTGIEEGNSNWYDKDKLQINVEKILLLGNRLFPINEAHKTSYLLTPVPAIQEFLSRLATLEEEELEEMSRKIEP